MSKYSVNVHYDYCVSVEVEAEDVDEALELAEIEASNTPLGSGDWFMEATDSCITNVED